MNDHVNHEPKFLVMKQFIDHDKAHNMLTDLYNKAKHLLPKDFKLIDTIQEYIELREDADGEFGCTVINDDNKAHIFIRLRTVYTEPENQFKFLSLEEITRTLLHEMTHCRIGPHNKKFHRLCDQLIKNFQITYNHKHIDIKADIMECYRNKNNKYYDSESEYESEFDEEKYESDEDQYDSDDSNASSECTDSESTYSDNEN